MMKQLAILFATLCTIGFMANEAQAQHFHRGHGHGHYVSPVRSTGFAISIGNGFNGVSYSNFRGVGGFGGVGVGGFGVAPVYRPSFGYGYGRPVYGRPVYGGGFGGYGYRGGYGRPGCGW